ncbi:ribosome biogenesis GTPase Der [Dasania sp. GY-MA-18]|uniref:GTPase Der n=1 Tax=Dasania phycosphaerae TaxID=2950436 RepID=A0A9J6RRL4_9GAMM|nr:MULTISPECIES: ribosome biogenesis GTPase Der [Dasania]MCR8924163.1 ribosome biogenesis GTPase Der [Dasania sp. GY-MA-18]MCZ0866816.1 ribosome biogenesis GTPase Der [Dasania phycosphaerae]MCZ0870321.1 ribosome biogenesis GTPase Der [Dasania phycosphaerae]
MVPVIALVGRPNVGKSTLFNRLTKTRDALVANFPGLTRDRKYGEAKFDSRHFIVIDTGGITGDEEGLDAEMAGQSMQAIDEADAVLFMLDSRAGLTASDQLLANHLRQISKPVFYVANKIDGVNPDVAMADFYSLGVKKIHPTTATHGKGVRQLLEDVFELFPQTEEEAEPEDEDRGVKIAVVGRPNVGKSTLVNRMLGEERVVVYDHPGTTRDSIYIDYEREGVNYTLIDTAGVRRRKNVKETVEKFSIVKALKAIDDTNVVILVLDAHEGIVDQDLHLLGHSIDAGRALVVAINKWDGLDADQKNRIKSELDRRLQFIDFAEIHFISALHGTGVGHLYESIDNAYRSSTNKLQTNKLTQILEAAVYDHAPPMVNGRRIKLRYAHAGGFNPPIIVIHGNQTAKVPASYQRYLEKTFRRQLDLVGTPIRIEFKSSENPYAEKQGDLSQKKFDRKKRIKRQAVKRTEAKKPDNKKPRR